MAGEARAIIAYVLDTLLPSIDGGNITMPGDGSTHACTFNLTGAGRIVCGRPPSAGPELLPDGEPVVYLWTGTPTVSYAEDTPGTLYGFGVVVRLNLRGYVGPQDVAGEGDTARGRLLRAADLMDDLMAAVQADRGLGGNATGVVARWDSFDGAEIHGPAYGVAAGELTITTART